MSGTVNGVLRCPMVHLYDYSSYIRTPYAHPCSDISATLIYIRSLSPLFSNYNVCVPKLIYPLVLEQSSAGID